MSATALAGFLDVESLDDPLDEACDAPPLVTPSASSSAVVCLFFFLAIVAQGQNTSQTGGCAGILDRARSPSFPWNTDLRDVECGELSANWY